MRITFNAYCARKARILLVACKFLCDLIFPIPSAAFINSASPATHTHIIGTIPDYLESQNCSSFSFLYLCVLRVAPLAWNILLLSTGLWTWLRFPSVASFS